MPNTRPSKKKLVIADLFSHCQANGDYTFDNDLVGRICKKHRFRNPFDVTKADNSLILPEHVVSQGYCIVHLGEGSHKFVRGVESWFHKFEEIGDEEIPWKYRKSALNDIDKSESTILSIGFNQRIVHDFLYDDIVASPKMYGSRRTKIDATYRLGEEEIRLNKMQIEVDLVTEYQGRVTVFEGKNKFPQDFAVYQLFHPFVYFSQFQQNGKIEIKEVNCCYLLRKIENGVTVLRLYLYTFSDVNDAASISLIKSAQYRLLKR